MAASGGSSTPKTSSGAAYESDAPSIAMASAPMAKASRIVDYDARRYPPISYNPPVLEYQPTYYKSAND